MMMKLCLVPCLLLGSAESFAHCTSDAPEIGDIGPSSELVCRELERRFPAALTAVDNRTIVSPKAVAVQVRVDGEPMLLRYDLAGFEWTLTKPSDEFAVIGRDTQGD
jgi:hypothetical protein